MKKFEEARHGVISTDLIFLDHALDQREEVIRFVVEAADFVGYVKDGDELYRAIERRESEISTAIGYKIAIPHGKTATVQHPFIAFLRTKNAFQWGKKEEEMVQLIFLIGVPKDSEETLHLKFISALSKKLLDNEFREKLLMQKDKYKIFEQLNAIEI